MTAEIFRAQISFNRLAMTVIVHVGSDEINHIILNQIIGNTPYLLAIVTGKTENVDLKQGAALMQPLIAVVLRMVVGIALGVSKDRLESLEFQIEKHAVDVQRFLNIGILDKQIIVGERPHIPGFQLLKEISIEAVFSRIIKFNVNPCILNSLFQAGECSGDCFRCVFKCILSYVRCAYNAVDAPAFLMSHEVGSRNSITLAVINAWSQMAMHVGLNKKLRSVGRFSSEKVEHHKLFRIKC